MPSRILVVDDEPVVTEVVERYQYAASPFTLKPLAGEVAVDATDHVNYPLDNNAQNFPSGTASVS